MKESLLYSTSWNQHHNAIMHHIHNNSPIAQSHQYSMRFSVKFSAFNFLSLVSWASLFNYWKEGKVSFLSRHLKTSQVWFDLRKSVML